MPDFTNVPQNAVDSADHIYDATYKFVYDKTTDARLATEKGAHVAAGHLMGSGIISQVLGTGLSVVADCIAVIVDQMTQAKKGSLPGLNALIAATLGDALLIDIEPTDLPTGEGGAAQAQRNATLGKKWVDALKQFCGANGEVTPESAEQGAAALVGMAMLMSVNTGLLAFVGGAVPMENLQEIKEIGEMLEKSLGLGRLVRRGLTPLIQQTVALPLQKKYAAQYRQNLIGAPELVREWLAGRISEEQCNQWLAEHGLTDTFIEATKAQHTPSLHAGEIEELISLGAIDAVSGAGQLKAQGLPDSIVSWQLQLHTRKRLAHLRNHILSEVLTQINQGFADPSDIEKWFTQLSISQDEAQMWRQAAGLAAERTRKRLSHGDMLFLYEAAQITDLDVEAWARDEGYTENDVQQLLTVFRLKAAAAATTKTGGTAARTAHLHKEHIAYVTDEITGLWGRSPTAAELNYWVNLIDTGERTKHDFTTELKDLDTDGPAMPT